MFYISTLGSKWCDIMNLEDIYYLVGYIVCDVFLMWYLPSNTIVNVIINIVIATICMVGIYTIIRFIYKKIIKNKNK